MLRKIIEVGSWCGLQGEARQLLFQPWTVHHRELHFSPVEGSLSLVFRFAYLYSAKPQSTTEQASGMGVSALFLETVWPTV